MLRVLYLLRRLFYSVWRFSRSSGFADKFVAITLVILTLLSLFNCNSHAAEPTGFNSIDFSYSAKAFGSQGEELITTLVKKQRGTFYGTNCTEFIIPGDFKVDGSVFMELDLFTTQSLNSDNVYNLHYEYAALDPRRVIVTACKLVFIDNAGNVLREQDIFSDPVEKYTWQTVDLNFKPNVRGLAGYQCKFFIGFTVENGPAPTSIYISERVDLLNSNSNDNSTWFQKIINAIKELPEKLGSFFENLGNQISGFFTDLWNKLKVQFDNIGKWFSDLKDSILNWFDKFKPRVYEDFAWELGIPNAIGNIISPPSNINKVVTSELFYVPYEYDTIFRLTDRFIGEEYPAVAVSLYSYTKSNDGSYLLMSRIHFNSSNINQDIILDKGLSYRFMISYDMSWGAPTDNLSSHCNGIVQVFTDEGWLTSFGHWILNGIKRLFVPPSYFWQENIDSFKANAENHLGMLYQAPEYFINTINKLVNIKGGDNILIFPSKDITFTMPDGTVHTLFTANQFYLDFNSYVSDGQPLNHFYGFYRIFIKVAISFMFLNYARKKYVNLIEGGSD